MLTDNALQFGDLRTAEEFLFSLPEYLRAKIGHIRLLVPYSMLMNRKAKAMSRARMECEWCKVTNSKGKTFMDPDEYERDDYSYFAAISNYYSVPWDRKMVCVEIISDYLWEEEC